MTNKSFLREHWLLQLTISKSPVCIFVYNPYKWYWFYYNCRDCFDVLLLISIEWVFYSFIWDGAEQGQYSNMICFQRWWSYGMVNDLFGLYFLRWQCRKLPLPLPLPLVLKWLGMPLWSNITIFCINPQTWCIGFIRIQVS